LLRGSGSEVLRRSGSEVLRRSDLHGFVRLVLRQLRKGPGPLRPHLRPLQEERLLRYLQHVQHVRRWRVRRSRRRSDGT
jgi:hypothetical protein